MRRPTSPPPADAAPRLRASLRPVGEAVRAARTARHLTLEDLAHATGLSKGVLSKIENFRALPSLPALASIARALAVPLERFVAEVEVHPERRFQLIRRGAGRPVARSDSPGCRYVALQAATVAGLHFQALELTVEPGVSRAARTTDGDEYLMVREGRLELTLAGEVLLLDTGDSIYFDGRLPHALRNTGRGQLRALVMYLLHPSGHGDAL